MWNPSSQCHCRLRKIAWFFFPSSNYLNGVLAPFSLKQDITFIDIVAAATSVKLTERRSWPILMMDLVLSNLQHNLSWGTGSLLPMEGPSISARRTRPLLPTPKPSWQLLSEPERFTLIVGRHFHFCQLLTIGARAAHRYYKGKVLVLVYKPLKSISQTKIRKKK